MLKALIVEDEERIRNTLVKHIPWDSYGINQVREADNGASAIDISLNFKPDIIISDIFMPHMTGIEFATRMRREQPACKLIFISAYSEKEYFKSAIQLKAVRYIEKPINFGELKEAIRLSAEECRYEINKMAAQIETSEKLNTSITMLLGNFAVNLIDKYPNLEHISRVLTLSGLNIPLNGSYLTIIFKINPPASYLLEKQSALCGTLNELICKVFSDMNISHITGRKDGMHIISHVHLTPYTNISTVKKAVGNISQNFSEYLMPETSRKNLIFIAIGKSVAGIVNMYSSYQTAFLALQKIFFLGNSNAVIYQDDNSNDTLTLDDSLINKFTGYLSSFDKNSAFSFIKINSENIQKCNTMLPDNIKNFYYALLLKILEEAEERLIVTYIEYRQKEYIWQMVWNSLTLDELTDFLIRETGEYFRIVEEKGGKSRSVYETISFIQKHYTNSNLTINDISQNLNLSPAHLCKIFKKETGKTINDYINEYRVGKAKELLKDRGIKLYEVSLNTGYNNTKYFTRVFKKMSGTTPSEFREGL